LENILLKNIGKKLALLFRQASFENLSVRLATFPDNWQQVNELQVSTEQVAEAGNALLPTYRTYIPMYRSRSYDF
jgi:hypothetical protein